MAQCLINYVKSLDEAYYKGSNYNKSSIDELGFEYGSGYNMYYTPQNYLNGMNYFIEKTKIPKVKITEYMAAKTNDYTDFASDEAHGLTSEQLDKRAHYLRDVLLMAYSNSQLTGFLFTGYTVENDNKDYDPSKYDPNDPSTYSLERFNYREKDVYKSFIAGDYFYDNMKLLKYTEDGVSDSNGNYSTNLYSQCEYVINVIVGNKTYTKTIHLENDNDVVFKVGLNYCVGNNYYSNLESAYNSIEGNDGLITLMQDVTDNSIFNVENGKTITLDTNGHTLNKVSKEIINNGSLKIIGRGTITTTEANTNVLSDLIINNGNLEIDNCTLINKGLTAQNSNLVNETDWTTIMCIKGSVLLKNGTIKSEYSLIPDTNLNTSHIARAVYLKGNSNFEMRDGTISTDFDDSYAILVDSNNGDELPQVNIDIIGGNVISNNTAIYLHSGNNKLIIEGGTINGDEYGIYSDNTNSEIMIKIGKIVSPNNVAVYNTGESIVTVGVDNNKLDLANPIIQGNNYGINSKNGFRFFDGIIKGFLNTYSEEPTVTFNNRELNNQKEIIEHVEYKTVTILKPYSVENQYFETFNDALASISGDNGTIQLHMNIDDNSTISIAKEKAITVDTNGYTLTRGKVVENNGTLIIKGGGVLQTSNPENNTLAILIKNTGTLKLNKINLIHNGRPDGDCYTIFSDGGNIIIDNAQVCANTAKGICRTIELKNGADLTMTDGLVYAESPNGRPITVYVSETYPSSDNKIKIENGILESKYGNAILVGATSGYTANVELEIINGKIVSKDTAIKYSNGSGGIIKIEQGSILSSNGSAIENKGTAQLTVGTIDYKNLENPIIQGEKYGIDSNIDFYYYSGVLKGIENPYNTNVKVNYLEDQFELLNGEEIINNSTYKTLMLRIINTQELTVEFKNVEEIEKNGNKYIKIIKPGTLLKELINNIETNGFIGIYKDMNKLEDKDVKTETGMILRITLENEKKEYKLVVMGDCNGDGDANIKDMIIINNYRLSKITDNFDEAYKIAGDVNGDEELNIRDMILINNFRLKGTSF